MKQTPKAFEIQPHKAALLSGPVLMLRPYFALEFGGVAEGLIYQQIAYRSGFLKNGEEGISPVRYSYSALQRQLPFFSRRWVIEVIRKLEAANAILVKRGPRVNTYSPNPTYDCQVEISVQKYAPLLVFPRLAFELGLNEAVVLQQIHIRHAGSDCWAIRSFKDWRENVFMFWSDATIKRTFLRLRAAGLVLVKPYTRDDGVTVNSYRANYKRLSQLLGIGVAGASNAEIAVNQTQAPTKGACVSDEDACVAI